MLALLASVAFSGRGFTAVFGGDIMLNSIPVGHGSFDGIADAFKSGAVAFANLEVPLTDARVPTSRKSAAELAARSQYILKGDPGHVQEIKEAGIDLVALGNNHAMDYREAGMRQMTGLLDKAGILHTGAGVTKSDAMRVVVYRLADGTRVGLISSLAFESVSGAYHTTSATDRSAGVMYLMFRGKVDDSARRLLVDWVRQAHQKCDLLVVGLHWGIERMPVPSPYQVALGRAFIDAGADAVWGHHPHVIEGAEVYKGKPIMYSMGNLVSHTPATTGLIRIYFRDGKFNNAKFLPAQVSGWRTRLVGGNGGMHSLCQRLERRFPSPHAKAMF